jgi:hypothetical protein
MTKSLQLTFCLFFLSLQLIGKSSPKIDPIKFEIKTYASSVEINEEFEILITAKLLNIPANTVYIFKDANSFRLKLILPDGFVQTGGDYADYVGGELTAAKPVIKYSLKGKFTTEGQKGMFRLLRSHSNATDQSNFIEVGNIGFTTNQQSDIAARGDNARISLDVPPSYIPYLTISQLRAGAADTSSVVFITDKPRDGLFKYNPSSTQSDDGAMVLVSSGRRYERVYDGVVNVNWFGIVGDGSTDYTAALQTLLNNVKYSSINFPASAASYRIRAIKIPSNKTLTFADNTVIEGMGTLGTYDPMVYLIAVSNIVIKGRNVVFKDHREKYTTGQQRHIFLMQGVKNVLIDGISANDGGGDGFYIGATSVIRFSENVTLINVQANNNRRQGISVTSGKNILIENAILSNSNGENPAAGLDIEPNAADALLENIRIISPITRNNKGAGILISPALLSNVNRPIDILVANHTDDGSFYGFLTSTVKGSLPGTITVRNPIWKNSYGCAFVSRNWSAQGPTIEVLNPTVIDPNTGGSTSPNLGAAFLIYKAANDTGDQIIGNVHIFNPDIQDTRAKKLVTSSFCYRDLVAGRRIIKCSLTDPILSPFSPPSRFAVVHNAELAVSDKNRYLTTDFGAYTRYVNYTYYSSLYHNQTSTTTRILNLDKVNANFPEVTVEVRAAQPIRIVPAATDNILPNSTINGKYITSGTVGSKVVLKKTTDNNWFIKEMVGTWTVQP